MGRYRQMNKAERPISDKDLKDITDYFSLDKIIEEEKRKRKSETKNNVKIAILSSFTSRGLKEVLNVKCHRLDIASELYTAPYNQYMQEILNKESALYKFNPDIIFIFIDIKSLLGEHFYFPYRLSAVERENLFGSLINELNTALDFLRKNSKAKIILHNFEVPFYSPMGILENKAPFGFVEAVASLNNRLRDNLKNDSRVFLFDYDAFCSKHGKKNIIDPKMYYLADLKLNFPLIILLSDEYLSYIKPQLNLVRKCLVLDLDDTLWGGILGEDGLEGISLGTAHEGKAFLEFQKYILSLHEKGVILAINSHNNHSDALEVFQNHPHMILKERHFASLKINWEDKVTNMIEIAKEINIGLDSIVYIDDDFRNRELIKGCLPEVRVIELPDDPSLYSQTLMAIDDFNAFQITDEDRLRGKIYVAQRQRKELLVSCSDINDFLKRLEMTATIFYKPDSFIIPRISQLMQRTNQFNMTTRRYQENGIKRLIDSRDSLVYAIKVEDRFGDNGIVGAAIIKKRDSSTWCIDSFLLSCRVLGRGIEKAFLSLIINKAVENRVNTLLGLFIPTGKNIPARDFYKESGFIQINQGEGEQTWKMEPVSHCSRSLDFIKVVEKD